MSLPYVSIFNRPEPIEAVEQILVVLHQLQQQRSCWLPKFQITQSIAIDTGELVDDLCSVTSQESNVSMETTCKSSVNLTSIAARRSSHVQPGVGGFKENIGMPRIRPNSSRAASQAAGVSFGWLRNEAYCDRRLSFSLKMSRKLDWASATDGGLCHINARNKSTNC